MADTLQKLLDSMNPQQPAIVQSATATQEIPIFGNDLEICNMMPRFVENAGVAKTKKDNNPAKNAKGKNTRPLNSFMAFRCKYFLSSLLKSEDLLANRLLRCALR